MHPCRMLSRRVLLKGPSRPLLISTASCFCSTTRTQGRFLHPSSTIGSQESLKSQPAKSSFKDRRRFFTDSSTSRLANPVANVQNVAGPLQADSAMGPIGKLETQFNEEQNTWEVFALQSGAQQQMERIKMPRIWLRDHCQCPECIHPATRQRQLDVFKINDLTIEDCSVSDEGLHITWREGPHSSLYPIEVLETLFKAQEWYEFAFPSEEPLSWSATGRSIRDQPPEVEYEKIMHSAEGLAEWTGKIREYGFCFVNGCPANPEATEELLARIGPIRNTHYGAFWDFTSDLASKDTAYTSLGLDVHTDTTYFTDPAGLQLFHLLSHDGQGGETQLVDGFRAAYKLKEIDPDAYEMLKTFSIHSHASGNEGISIQPNFGSTVLHTREYEGKESVVMVRWNTYDRTAMPLKGSSMSVELGDWYKAAKKFHDVLHSGSPDIFYEVQLKPGRPLIFDNWRVLHGRSAFDGRRRMCGGYIGMDDFISRYKTTKYGWEAVTAPGRV